MVERLPEPEIFLSAGGARWAFLKPGRSHEQEFTLMEVFLSLKSDGPGPDRGRYRMIATDSHRSRMEGAGRAE